MSGIGEAMKQKGYTPLADDGKGGIGFKANMKGENNMDFKPVEFDTGLKMSDGKTPRKVVASSEEELNGLRKAKALRGVPLAPTEGITTSKGAVKDKKKDKK